MGGLTNKIVAVSRMGKLMAVIKTYDRKSYEIKIENDVIKINI